MTFKEARLRAGVTQLDVYRYLGIPTRTQQHWEAEDRKFHDWMMNAVITAVLNLGAKKTFVIGYRDDGEYKLASVESPNAEEALQKLGIPLVSVESISMHIDM